MTIVEVKILAATPMGCLEDCEDSAQVNPEAGASGL
jgi:hypothetical protein